MEERKGGAGMAIASMVLGIVALVVSCCLYYISIPCAVIGIILAAVSISTGRDGKGMAIAGLVCSIISLVPSVIILIAGTSIISMLGVM